MTPPPPPVVLVLVGTDHHPFDRLVGWIDDWLSSLDPPVRCLVQYGRSAAPRVAEGVAFLNHDDVERLIESARVVVSHGGPTTIAEARRRGHHPVVVARDPRAGEHVDDHQMRFAGRLAQSGLVELVTTADELDRTLGARLHDDWTPPESSIGPDPAESARRFGTLMDALVADSPVKGRRRAVS